MVIVDLSDEVVFCVTYTLGIPIVAQRFI